MAYSKIEWVNGSTALNAENLNHMDNQIATNELNIASANGRINALIAGPLQPAGASLGLVKPDGVTTKVSSDGTISSSQPGKASSEGLGLVKPDNTTIRISGDGTLTAIGGGGPDRPTQAVEVNYNDTSTQLGANNVQNAIEKVTTKLSDYEDAGYLPKEGVTSKSNVQLTNELLKYEQSTVRLNFTTSLQVKTIQFNTAFTEIPMVQIVTNLATTYWASVLAVEIKDVTKTNFTIAYKRYDDALNDWPCTYVVIGK